MNKSATNSTHMKLSNKWLILNIIRKKPVSRAELARTTGLTRAAVTLIVEELLKDGILTESGTAEAEYGRKPVLLDLKPDYGYSLGVSIVRDGCTLGILDMKGVLLSKTDVALDASFDAGQCIQTIAAELKKAISDAAIPYEKIPGIGINAPGPVDIHSGVILNPPNFDIWHHVNIVQELKKSFPFSIYLENNSTSLALAEKNYGRGAQFSSFMLLVVDVGIGAGIIINDQLYRGAGGFGSEVGHTSVDMNGVQCSCGNKGCLEVYASIPSVLKDIHPYDRDISTWRDIVDRALKGDKPCLEAIDKEALYLSAGIVNAMNILELEAVILTGDINYKPEILLDRIRHNVGRSAMTRNINKLHIMDSSITKDAAVISAASVVLQKFFRGEAEWAK